MDPSGESSLCTCQLRDSHTHSLITWSWGVQMPMAMQEQDLTLGRLQVCQCHGVLHTRLSHGIQACMHNACSSMLRAVSVDQRHTDSAGASQVGAGIARDRGYL